MFLEPRSAVQESSSSLYTCVGGFRVDDCFALFLVSDDEGELCEDAQVVLVLFGSRDEECEVHRLLIQGLPFHAVAEDADGDEEVLHPSALDVGNGDILPDTGGHDVFPVQHCSLELLEIDHMPGVIGKGDELASASCLSRASTNAMRSRAM